jgi:hypothetical protein
MLVRSLVTLPDGSSRFHYQQEPIDPSKPVCFTGPAKGNYTTDDGTVYNVSDDWVEFESMQHFGEVSHKVGLAHEQDGHPTHKPRNYVPTDDDPTPYAPETDEFVHVCNDLCGVLARSPEDAVNSLAERVSRYGGDDKGAEFNRRVTLIHKDHAEHRAASAASEKE